jgi:hypothetical protein
LIFRLLFVTPFPPYTSCIRREENCHYNGRWQSGQIANMGHGRPGEVRAGKYPIFYWHISISANFPYPFKTILQARNAGLQARLLALLLVWILNNPIIRLS